MNLRGRSNDGDVVLLQHAVVDDLEDVFPFVVGGKLLRFLDRFENFVLKLCEELATTTL